MQGDIIGLIEGFLVILELLNPVIKS